MAVNHAEATCCFCQQPSSVLGSLVEGPDERYVCRNCAACCQMWFANHVLGEVAQGTCSFCRTSSQSTLPGTTGVHICSDCADLASHIFLEEDKRRSKRKQSQDLSKAQQI